MRTPFSLYMVLIALAAGQAAAQEVYVFSSRHYNTGQAFYDGFTGAAGIKINLIEPEAPAAAVPENLRHPDGLWFGLSKNVRGIVYAKDRADPSVISTYEDLAGPAWLGKICIRSSSNVYNQSLAASMIAAGGLDAAEGWANGIAANMARGPQGGDTDWAEAEGGDVSVTKRAKPSEAV